MKNLLIGGLIGYGIAWALNSPQGRGLLGNAQRGMSSIETKLGKALDTKPKDKKEEEVVENEEDS